MDLFDNTWYTAAVSITVVILIASSIYTIRNIMKIWKSGTPTPVSAKNSDNTNENANTDDEVEEIDRPAFEGIFVELKKK
jgi:hypothetical protein